MDELNQDYYELFENAPNACIILKDNSIIVVNKTFSDLVKLPKNKIIKRKITHFIHKKFLNIFFSKQSRVKQGEKVSGFEIKIQSPAIGPLRVFVDMKLQNNRDDVYVSIFNIQKFKTKEYHTKLSEDKYRNLLESFTDVVITIDDKSIVTYWNKEAARISGIDEKDILGKKIEQIFPLTEELLELRTLLDTLLHCKTPISFEQTIPFKTYNRIYEVNVFPNRKGISIHARDKTERIRIEKQLSFQSQVLQNMIIGLHIVFVKDNTIAYTNLVMEEMFGYDKGELIGKHVSILNDPNNPEIHEIIINSLIKSGKWEGEVLNKRKDGSLFWSRAKVSEFDHYEYGRVWISIHENIDDIKNTSIRLEESQRELELIYNNIPVLVSHVDRNYRYKFANRAYINFFGRNDIIGKKIAEIIGEESFQRSEINLQKAFEGNIVVYDNILYDKDKLSHDVEVTYIPHFENGENRGIFIIVSDITVRKKYEESIIKSKEIAESANRTKSEFLANMSHEIRTPMTSILGFAELIDQKTREPELKKYTERIHKSGNILLNLINDILDLSKIEANKIEIELKPVNLKEMINELLLIFQEIVNRKGIRLSLDYPKSLSRNFLLDEFRIRQILLNLIGNAIKFTDAGSVKIKVSIRRKEEGYNNAKLQVQVIDTGIGIEKGQLSSIFDSFSQGKTKDSNKYSGTGLGLSISKKLAKLMGGDIWVYSKPNFGSIFTLQIDKVSIISQSEFNLIPSNSSEEIVTKFGKTKVLIVDDDDINRELIITYLQKIPELEYIEAIDGEEAIDKAEKCYPDLIIMDLNLPKINGFDAIKHLKSLHKTKNIPIIAVTASVLNFSKEEVEHFSDAYLYKPLVMRDLLRQLKILLRSEEVLTQVVEDKFDKEKARIIYDVLQKKLSKKYNEITVYYNISRIISFAEKAKKISINYDYSSLKDWSEELLKAANSFDIVTLKEELSKFPQCLDKLKNMI